MEIDIKDSLKIINFQALVYSNGKMERFIKVNTLMIEKKEKGY